MTAALVAAALLPAIALFALLRALREHGPLDQPSAHSWRGDEE